MLFTIPKLFRLRFNIWMLDVTKDAQTVLGEENVEENLRSR